MVSGITYHSVKFSNNHCLLEAIEKAWQCTVAVVSYEQIIAMTK